MNPIRINLLPHRQLRRAQQQRLFAILAIAVAGIWLAVVAIGQMRLVNAKHVQDSRNTFLREENAKLDKQIAEDTAGLRVAADNRDAGEPFSLDPNGPPRRGWHDGDEGGGWY